MMLLRYDPLGLCFQSVQLVRLDRSRLMLGQLGRWDRLDRLMDRWDRSDRQRQILGRLRLSLPLNRSDRFGQVGLRVLEWRMLRQANLEHPLGRFGRLDRWDRSRLMPHRSDRSDQRYPVGRLDQANLLDRLRCYRNQPHRLDQLDRQNPLDR